MLLALAGFVALNIAVAIVVGREIVRRRDRRAVARWTLLSSVGEVLADILHSDATLEDVARLLVPEFADWCTLHVIEYGVIQRAAVAHANPDVERRLQIGRAHV